MSLRRGGGRRIRGRDSWGRCDDIFAQSTTFFVLFLRIACIFSRRESLFFSHVDNGWFSAAYGFGSGPIYIGVDGGGGYKWAMMSVCIIGYLGC